MRPDDIPEKGWRGSRELWLEAAFDALVEGGVDAVKIQPLASRLKLSRTSFYWFFKDREALLTALIDQWDAKNTGELVAAAGQYAETPTEAVLNVIACFIDETAFDARLEFAVRGWALQSPDVMARVNDADLRRLSVLREMLERHGYAPDDADVRARAVYLVQIGYISMRVRETLQTRMQRVPGYIRIYTGLEPSDSEMARFYARHGYDPQSAARGADAPAG